MCFKEAYPIHDMYEKSVVRVWWTRSHRRKMYSSQTRSDKQAPSTSVEYVVHRVPLHQPSKWALLLIFVSPQLKANSCSHFRNIWKLSEWAIVKRKKQTLNKVLVITIANEASQSGCASFCSSALVMYPR